MNKSLDDILHGFSSEFFVPFQEIMAAEKDPNFLDLLSLMDRLEQLSDVTDNVLSYVSDNRDYFLQENYKAGVINNTMKLFTEYRKLLFKESNIVNRLLSGEYDEYAQDSADRDHQIEVLYQAMNACKLAMNKGSGKGRILLFIAATILLLALVLGVKSCLNQQPQDNQSTTFLTETTTSTTTETTTETTTTTTTSSTESQSDTQSQTESTTQENPEGMQYVGDVPNKKFHKSNCPELKEEDEGNYVRWNNRQDLVDQGYAPCGTCNP